MCPVTKLARLPRTNFVSARLTRMKFEKHNQLVEHKLVSFATVTALWTLETLLIKLIPILPK